MDIVKNKKLNKTMCIAHCTLRDATTLDTERCALELQKTRNL